MRPRSHLSEKERMIVARIRKLISDPGLIRANLINMKRPCGNKNCRCTKGRLHESIYLSQSNKGKQRMLFVPKELEKDVKKWTEKHREIKVLMDQLSQIYWDKIKDRKV